MYLLLYIYIDRIQYNNTEKFLQITQKLKSTTDMIFYVNEEVIQNISLKYILKSLKSIKRKELINNFNSYEQFKFILLYIH